MEKEEKSLWGNPCNQEKRAGGQSEHQERAEVVIVWLAAQSATLCHGAHKLVSAAVTVNDSACPRPGCVFPFEAIIRK